MLQRAIRTFALSLKEHAVVKVQMYKQYMEFLSNNESLIPFNLTELPFFIDLNYDRIANNQITIPEILSKIRPAILTFPEVEKINQYITKHCGNKIYAPEMPHPSPLNLIEKLEENELLVTELPFILDYSHLEKFNSYFKFEPRVKLYKCMRGAISYITIKLNNEEELLDAQKKIHFQYFQRHVMRAFVNM
jgi:hypothetical protein